MQIELKHGNTSQQSQLKLGDSYPRMLREPASVSETAPQSSSDGPLAIEGYCECHLCHRDFFVTVSLENNRLTSAQVDITKPGYIGDETESR